MEGQTLSHYKVLEKLGGGGMGVVYKALDTHLDRHVALKLLPPELTRDDDARERFVLEAKAASALDHPNICTIHDIDETPDGQMFIAMGYYDGETLKKRIERGLLPVAEALDIAMQVAQGLTKAHESGIVHRDIKPANVIVTADGLVKIVDFGIAKLLGVTGPTQTGTTLGTVSYMSPEQVSGQNADERSDVWSLGAVLYEMLTGERPFQGDNQWAVMNAIRAVDPKAPSSLRPEVSESVEGLVNRALEKVPDKRIPSASDFVAAARIPFAQATKPPRVPEDTSGFRTRRMVLAAVLAGAAVVAVGVWVSRSDGDSGLTSQRQIDEVQGLISDDSYFAAFEAAELLDASTAGGPAMSDLWPQISAVGSLITDPPGAEVFYRAYSNPNAQWRRLGEAPLEGIRLPRGFLSLRIERNGFVSRQLAALNPDPLGNFLRETPVPVALAEGGTIPERMVSVPSRSVREIAQGMITGNDPVAPIPLGEFLIDQYEVTNREFKQFVDGGGYGNPDLWADEFRLDGLVLTRDEAMADLVDATGRPGPSTWELGTYPTGEDDHPVRGWTAWC